MQKYGKKEIKTMAKLMRETNDTVMQRKYHVIFLYMKGYTNVKISEITTLHQKTIGVYINTYKTLGLEALVPKKSSGRPSLLSKEQERKLYETVSNKTPDEVGFDGFKNWTSKLICQWVLKEFRVKYSINGMLDMLHRLKLSYTRPTYVLARADPEKQAKFKSDFEEVKKNC
jgi:transposase